MLLEFTVENYLSIKEPVTLSMVASKDKDNLCNVINPEDLKTGKGVLKSAVIYGANASGKTNIIKAFNFMQEFIFEISKNILPTDKIKFTPFKFDEKTPKQSSRFEVTFIYKNIKYFYGFSLDREKVHEEYLYYYPKGRQAILFERTHTDKYKNSKKIFIENTGKNKLYLTTLAQNNDETAKNILEWFNSIGILLSNERVHRMVTIDKFKENKEQVIDFLKKIDSGVKDLTINESEMTRKHLPPDMPDEIKELILAEKGKFFEVITTHEVNKNGTKKNYSLYMTQESAGTQKFFEMAGFLINIIESNGILIIDELEQSFHPELLKKIITLFHSENNKAQLIFTTHDTSQLNAKNFRKDQIYITEKNRNEQYTELYSLQDIKGIRTENFQKSYLQGKYGGIPFIDIEGVL